MRRVWIVGPIAWDTVLYVKNYPETGGFAQGIEKKERAGGTAGNVALALATSGIETGFVSYLGNDENGKKIANMLQQSKIKHLKILYLDQPTSHVLIVIDGTGDRTIFGLTKSHLNQVTLKNVELDSNDIVVFVVWHPYFLASLKMAQALGCTTIVGAAAINDATLEFADIVIGSRTEFKSEVDLTEHLTRFPRIVLTNGAEGAVQVTAQQTLQQSAFPAAVLDTTGAGDSFLAGYLTAYARGFEDGKLALEAGARWAALMVTKPISIPPDWSEVPGSADFFLP